MGKECSGHDLGVDVDWCAWRLSAAGPRERSGNGARLDQDADSHFATIIFESIFQFFDYSHDTQPPSKLF